MIEHWLAAARLRTLPLALSSILAGGALALNREVFSVKIFLWTCLCTILLQVLSNFANDYGDHQNGADNADRIGPKRAVQAGYISPSEMKRGVIITAIMAFGTGIYLLYISGLRMDLKGFSFLVLGIAAIAAAIRYTAGKDPYGYKGLGDLFVFLFFGLVGVLGSSALHDLSFPHALNLLPALAIGALSASVLNLNNMRDRIPDQAAGKMTLAVALGPERARTYHRSVIITALLAMLLNKLLSNTDPMTYIFLLSFPLFILHLKRLSKINSDKDLDPELKKVALSTFLLALLFFIGEL